MRIRVHRVGILYNTSPSATALIAATYRCRCGHRVLISHTGRLAVRPSFFELNVLQVRVHTAVVGTCYRRHCDAVCPAQIHPIIVEVSCQCAVRLPRLGTAKRCIPARVVDAALACRARGKQV